MYSNQTNNNLLPRTDAGQVTLKRMQHVYKDVMKNLYNSGLVLVLRIDVKQDRAGNISYTVTHQNMAGSRIVELAEVDNYVGMVTMGKEDDTTGEVISTYEVPVGGDSGNVLVKDLVIVNIKNASNCSFKEKGFCLHEDEKGNYSLEPLTKDSENEYTFACTSTSMKKKSGFFAARVTETRTREDIDSVINDLTGGAYWHQRDLLLAKQEAGDTVTPANIAKLYDRIGLLVTTPMIHVGDTRNLCIVNDSVDYGPQFKPEDEALLDEHGMSISRFFTDGYAVVGLDFVTRSFKESFGIDLSYEEAMRLSLQSRVDLITKKGLDRVFDADMMYAKAKNMINTIDYSTLQGEDPIVVTIDGITYNGKQLQEMFKNSPDEAKSILSKIDLLCTKDEAKMINWNGLKNSEYAKYFIINLGNPTTTNYSTQMLNKTATKNPKETKEFMNALIKYDYFAYDDKTKNVLTFNKAQEIVGDVLSNLFKVNPDKALSDKGAAIANLYDLDSYGRSKVGKCNPRANSHYLKLSPLEIGLVNYKLAENLRSRKVEYINELGEVMTVNCNVIYSPIMDKEASENIKMIKADKNLTNREKELMSNSCRVVSAMKFPTQGTDEFTLCYIISEKELTRAIDKTYGNTPTEKQLFNIVQMKKYIRYCPFSNVILFNDSTMLVQDAGSDLDGDDGTFLMNDLYTETLEDGSQKLHIGIFDDEAKKPIIGLISICVKKVVKNQSICTVINSDSDKKRAERARVEAMNKDTADKIEAYTQKRKYSKAKNTKTVKDNTSKQLSENKSCLTIKQALEGRITMRSEDFMELDFIPSNVHITDFLGLYQACSVFGDDIGMTVTLSSVIVNMPEEDMFDELNGFDFERAVDLLVPLQRAIASGEPRKTAKYVSVSELGENRFVLTNTSGITRDYYRMSDKEIVQMYNQIAALSENTTREEWRALQADFSHLGRNLGETSIDVAKNYTIKNTYTIYDFVNKSFRLVGNLKASYVKSNVYDFIKDEANEYSLGFGDYTKDGIEYILPDVIGDIKHDAARMHCEYMNQIGANLHDKIYYNYNCYNEYADIEIDSQSELYLQSVLDYIMDHVNPTYGLSKLDKETVTMLRKAVLNTTLLTGKSLEYSVRAMIKLAFTRVNRQTNKDGYVEATSRVVDTDATYNSRIKQVAKLFGDIFLSEYKDDNKDTLQVKVDYDVCTEDIVVGDSFEVVNGYNEAKTFHLTTDYTGTVVVLEDGVYAVYNTYEKAMEGNNLVIIPIAQTIKDGLASIHDGDTLTICRHRENKTIIIADETGKIPYASTDMVCPDALYKKQISSAYLFEYALDKVSGKGTVEYYNCFIIAELR